MADQSGKNVSFQETIFKEHTLFMETQKNRFPQNEILKIDLHCHDHNSDVPDELLGRILNVPETWLKTKDLLKRLRKNKADAITVTNHNNARSCYELKAQGVDVLVGAEFSCMVPDFQIGIHVLAYGFTEEQEKTLNKLRKNIYQFQQYTCKNNIPTIWAHPLYHYTVKGIPPMDFYNKMGLIFERFEGLNGQRDTWQNMLVKSWVDTLTPEVIDQYANQYAVDPGLYCRNPYRKSISAGSDSHMGIFSGQTATLLHVPDLPNRIKNTPSSELALEAIREGRMAPQGSYQNTEKLTIAFLEYFFQITLNKKDPGLMRILLHKGTTNDKIQAFLISNAFAELQQHKLTMNFIRLFHNCFTGKAPARVKRLMIPRVYKPVFDLATKIATLQEQNKDDMASVMDKTIYSIYHKLTVLLLKRISEKAGKLKKEKPVNYSDINEFIGKFEIPSEIRSLTGKSRNKNKRISDFNLGDFLDGLSFPFLATAVILGANFIAARVLYNTRPLLNEFSDKLGKLKHPKRALWLTDTFDGKNGVSMVLRQIHEEIKKHDLPIDILVCSNTVQPDDHLIVVKPLSVIDLPFYENQSIGIPDFLDVQNRFIRNGYDRVICSTEGVMGLLSLYLKHAFSVETSFYIHTDWITFARKVMNVDRPNLNRLRRLLRAFYSSFDSLFVLNSDHQKWLTSQGMDIPASKIYRTAHWADERFSPAVPSKHNVFEIPASSPVILYAGRISKEKGVMELPGIFAKLRSSYPNMQMVIAGIGPDLDQLKKKMPEALYLGWVETEKLPAVYSSADVLILPSRFDTFGCVVLEALSCGLPVLAYDTKGPRDIIDHDECGFLARNKNEMVTYAELFFSDKKRQQVFRKNALAKSKQYKPDVIMNDFLEVVGIAN